MIRPLAMCTSKILHELGLFTNEFSRLSGFRRGWPILDKLQWSDTRYVAYRLAKRPDERDWRSRPEKWELWKVSNVAVSEHHIKFILLLSVKSVMQVKGFIYFWLLWFLPRNWGGFYWIFWSHIVQLLAQTNFAFQLNLILIETA